MKCRNSSWRTITKFVWQLGRHKPSSPSTLELHAVASLHTIPLSLSLSLSQSQTQTCLNVYHESTHYVYLHPNHAWNSLIHTSYFFLSLSLFLCLCVPISLLWAYTYCHSLICLPMVQYLKIYLWAFLDEKWQNFICWTPCCNFFLVLNGHSINTIPKNVHA